MTVTVGALDHLVLSPATNTVTAGDTQTYAAEGFDAADNSLGDVTGATTFTIATGSCTLAVCGTTVPGPHLVTGNDSGATGTATLTVNADRSTTSSLAGDASQIAGVDETYTADGVDASDNVLGDVTANTTFDDRRRDVRGQRVQCGGGGRSRGERAGRDRR